MTGRKSIRYVKFNIFDLIGGNDCNDPNNPIEMLSFSSSSQIGGYLPDASKS